MIIVTGSVVARAESFAAMRDVSLAHARRSRAEDGCISHAVRIDTENLMKLVFFEEWRDVAALKADFQTPGVRELMAAIKQHSVSSEPISVFDATPVSL